MRIIQISYVQYFDDCSVDNKVRALVKDCAQVAIDELRDECLAEHLDPDDDTSAQCDKFVLKEVKELATTSD